MRIPQKDKSRNIINFSTNISVLVRENIKTTLQREHLRCILFINNMIVLYMIVLYQYSKNYSIIFDLRHVFQKHNVFVIKYSNYVLLCIMYDELFKCLMMINKFSHLFIHI